MIKEIFNTYISKYIVILINFISGIIIARYFGPEGKGELAAYLFIPQAIILYSELGISESVMHFTSKNLNINKKLFVKLFLSILSVSIIIYLIYSNFINTKLKLIGTLGPLLIILMFVKQLLSNYIRGKLLIKIFNYFSIIESSLLLICVIITYTFHLVIFSLLILYIIVYLASVLFLAYNANKVTNFSTNFVKSNDFFSYSFKTYTYKVLNSTESIFDKIMIVTFLSNFAFGQYSVIVSLSSLMYMIFISPISLILLPILNGKEADEKQKLIILLNKLFSIVILIFGIPICIFSEFFINIVYGSEFKSASFALSILMVGVIFKTPMSFIAYYFKSINKPEHLVKISFITLPLNIIGGIYFIPKLGIVGAAMVSSITYTLYSIILMMKFKKITNSNMSKFFIISRQELEWIKLNLIKLYNHN